ncbi:MAG: F0F1 ATP synthase subunit A [Phycisphaerae bacterium]|nr:F0F1 ATP synthase subunit A [Phycisphaerae bacterium]
MTLLTTILAVSENPIEHVADRPWKTTPPLGGDHFWAGHVLSSHIAVMILAAVLLTIVVLIAARLRGIRVQGKGYNLLEVLVLFVRDFIAKPALHGKAYRFMPFLLTLFFFILACNLLGMIPLLDISHAVAAKVPALENYPVGGTPTGNIWMTGSLATMTFLMIVGLGMAEQVRHFVHKGRPAILGWAIGFFLYLKSLMPPMTGVVKILMAPLLILLEFIGVLAKCFALAVRLFANMNAGHILLAVLLYFIWYSTTQAGAMALLVAPSSIIGSVAINLLELLVAFIQAFIFTFLAALFIGMSVNPQH